MSIDGGLTMEVAGHGTFGPAQNLVAVPGTGPLIKRIPSSRVAARERVDLLNEVQAAERLFDFVKYGGGPQNIILIYDVDLTLGSKPRGHFSGLHLNRRTFAAICDIIKGVEVDGKFPFPAYGAFCTGRGYNQVRHIINEAAHAPTQDDRFLPNITIAHNTGCEIHYSNQGMFPDTRCCELIIPKIDPVTKQPINPEAFKRGMDISRRLGDAVVAHIAKQPGMEELAGKYLVVEARERSSAVVITEHGPLTWDYLRDQTAIVCERLGGNEVVTFKGRTVDQNGKRMGYIDNTPTGINKAPATARILKHAMNGRDPKDFFVIAAGDNSAENPMMDQIAATMPPNNMLNICVGGNNDLGSNPNVNMIITGGAPAHRSPMPVTMMPTQTMAVNRHGEIIRAMRRIIVNGVMPEHDGSHLVITEGDAARAKAAIERAAAIRGQR